MTREIAALLTYTLALCAAINHAPALLAILLVTAACVVIFTGDRPQ